MNQISLDELKGEWLPGSDWQSSPTICNLSGSISTAANVTGLGQVAFHPLYSGKSDMLNLLLDGESVTLDEQCWSPHQVERRARAGAWEINSCVRLAGDVCGILMRMRIKNCSKAPANLDASLDVHTPLRSYRGEVIGFAPPSARLPDASEHVLRWFEGYAVTEDSRSQAITALAASHVDGYEAPAWQWQGTVEPGQEVVIDFALAVGEDLGHGLNVRTWIDDFERIWERGRTTLESRWQDAQTEGNARYSGHVSAPATDDPALRRVFGMGLLDLLLNERRNVHIDLPRCFVTASGKLGCASMYLWEASLCAEPWAQLDEPSLRAYLLEMLRVDWRECYALDQHTRVGLGVWYAVNAYAIWTLASQCLQHASDGLALLDEVVAGRSVGEHLEDVAWSWRERQDPKSGLMHCGDRWNLLECVNGYEHVTPAFNAAAISIMRGVAELLDQWQKDAAKGDALRQAADELLPRLLELYAGDGWWACLRNDGERRVVRELYDVVTILECIGDDLPEHVRTAMLDAIERECIEGEWMRALSLSDPESVARIAAGEKGRSDHAWTGCYPTWVAQAATAYLRFGRKETALGILQGAASVTRQGPFGQSFAYDSETGRLSKCISFTNPCGAAFCVSAAAATA